MGFDKTGLKLLIHSKQIGVNFDKVLTIGRQELFLKKKEFQKLADKIDLPKPAFEDVFSNNKYSEPFLKLLGANTIDSLDASQYEGATIVHDLNLPIPVDLKSKYTLIIDGGSLEHIFNFPAAIKNCMNAVTKGGHFIGITPANNFFGHGFYQFSPELYWRIFSEVNGFRMIKMYFYVHRKCACIFEVSDPLKVKRRITMINSFPSYLFVIAQKINDVEVFGQVPQQSDYENISWKEKIQTHSINKVTVSYLIRQVTPKLIRDWILGLYRSTAILKLYRSTGISNSRYIKKVHLNITNNNR